MQPSQAKLRQKHKPPSPGMAKNSFNRVVHYACVASQVRGQIQSWSNDYKRLLNKLYVNEATLRGQKMLLTS